MITDYTTSSSALENISSDSAISQDRHFNVPFVIRLRSCQDLFSKDFGILEGLFEGSDESPPKVQTWVDSGVFEFAPQKIDSLRRLLENSQSIDFRGLRVLPGGESSKMSSDTINDIWTSFNDNDLDRRSYVLAIGGGAALDLSLIHI